MAQNFHLRPQTNPSNRFETIQLEWEEGVVLPQSMHVFEEQAKSILAQNDSPDLPFHYSINPYRGCAHACAYCYARPTHEYLGLGAGTDFDTQIYAKMNARELLRKKLGSRSWTRETIVFSGITDCYQPAENQYKLTQGCLKACLEFKNPVSIITKSSLILRDLDLILKLDRMAGATVVLSIPFADPAAAKLIEPFAPSPEIRFRTLEKISQAGIKTGISLGPIIPGLNDQDIPSLLAQAKASGASFAFYVMLRLPGAVQEVFLDRVRQVLPDRAGKIEHHIRETRDGKFYQSDFKNRMSGTGKMAEMVGNLFAIHARRLGLEVGEWKGIQTYKESPPISEVINSQTNLFE